MQDYLNIFIDKDEYPSFIDNYLNTKTMVRLKYITQFCGCDYTNIYNPLFFFTRFDHSLVVAHMTWHFTHDKKETIAALLHDIGTPCFAHTIDYVLGDYNKQESSEKDICLMIRADEELLNLLEKDNIQPEELRELSKYTILENTSPRLCTDRLDGVLHTCYIWLHTHSIDDIRKVYDNMIVLENEDHKKEIGFQNEEAAVRFVEMVSNYSKELQSNRNKYVTMYISELVKDSVNKNIFNLDDLYSLKEMEIISKFADNYKTWKTFVKADKVIETNRKLKRFNATGGSKKRIAIPLLKKGNRVDRVTILSTKADIIIKEIISYRGKKYGYVKEIKNIV